MGEGLGISDREYRGWGCLALQLLGGAGAIAFGVLVRTEHVRHGRVAMMVVGAVILLVALLRVALNLIDAVSRLLRGRTGRNRE